LEKAAGVHSVEAPSSSSLSHLLKNKMQDESVSAAVQQRSGGMRKGSMDVRLPSILAIEACIFSCFLHLCGARAAQRSAAYALRCCRSSS
jgi:hypothetical protein